MKRLLFYARMILVGIPLAMLAAQFWAKPEVERLGHSIAILGSRLPNDPQAPLPEAQVRQILQNYYERLVALERDASRRSLLEQTFATEGAALALLLCGLSALVLNIVEFGYDRKQERKKSLCRQPSQVSSSLPANATASPAPLLSLNGPDDTEKFP